MNEKENSFPNFHFLEELVIKGVISSKTMDKVKIGTSVIEKKYKRKETKYNDNENLYNKINIYLNSINNTNTNLSEQEKDDIKKSIFKKISNYNRLLRQKLTEKRFEIITNIGQGSLGNVYMVRDKLNNKIYAMKKLSIPEIIRESQLFHVKIEKDILSMNSNNIWQTKLNYSFIEGDYLYYIIEHCPGGDLLSYFEMKDFLSEEEARFYIAEIILGVESLHKNKCIHRDIKPENIFIDKYGHLKLGDFGLSIISNNIMYPYTYKWKNSNDEIYNEKKGIKNIKDSKKIIGFSKVGSLLYVAPEVVENKSYGEEIDWWSVGIIFYEMLFGSTPFFEGTQEQIIEKIINFKKYLVVPNKVRDKIISKEAQKLIFDFLEVQDKRLGINGIDEIKNHPFFRNLDWDNLRNTKPPFIPKPLRIKELDLELDLKNNRLGLYTSKEIQNRKYNNLKNYLNKMNLNIYDFYYNKELEEIKYNINNNIIEIIKKQVNNYLKKKKDQKNILDEISTEDITPKPSFESGKKFIGNINVYNSTNLYNSETKNKYSFFAFDKIENAENKNIKKKKSIQIIPIRNLLFNNCKNSNYKDKKDLLYKSIRFGSGIKNKLMPNNNSINNNYSVNKDKTYLMTEKKHMSKSIFKDGNINNINNTEIKIKNKSKIKDKQIYKDNIINNIKPYHEHHEKNKSNINDNDIRKIKINGKLFLVKKNLGKFY